MSIELTVDKTITSIIERTWRAQLESPLTGGFRAEVFREQVTTCSDGTTSVKQNLTPIVLTLEELMADAELEEYQDIPLRLAALWDLLAQR